MHSHILKDQLYTQTHIYVELLENGLYFEAHEALEVLWFPKRFVKDDEIRLIRAYINAAVSFELVLRGRENSALKPWGFFLKNQELFSQVSLEHQPLYQSIHNKILQTQKKLNCFQI